MGDSVLPESSAVVAPCFPKEVRIAKTYTCRDAGVDCDWKVGGGDEAEVMPKIRDHARAVHKRIPFRRILNERFALPFETSASIGDALPPPTRPHRPPVDVT